MSEEINPCPSCKSLYGYAVNTAIYACPECGHEWNIEETTTEEGLVVKDMNGIRLQDGDAVIVMKQLPVKGSSPIKAGTKVKNIRLTDGDHNINCKIDGFGAMALKSEFVKKA
ncbi:MAG: phosphonoacetate hydrolase [Candidatus Magasanikbacteria bacterium CG_4_9_14_0_2_um_filter_41_10]|uniref:Phosphonoacetate hydrolase n=1 Tax=Candidatus Magasanikbacteria bacterium CG_4_10_14_0_2_um_filter_41_31 TaxID=1974639 RepID=A0A2M7V250_9BACT|nr:MAG: phosphonoacetate hydrolase [Candidatus Magasanikbacteria bacterium CG1_02_41_34]PIZ92500.1 MAG: phosphonoacetate hydrolase [Candidatus Magasanikbacteria bacterium CG_4_10_14_0_2_um_filter_41_31]PJC53381.1 MAG: phosphonoacetate hydrolase [Candidatus Magasanikbacteria bacterium CG_4_9_14_0_2_um_filter_41_10]